MKQRLVTTFGAAVLLAAGAIAADGIRDDQQANRTVGEVIELTRPVRSEGLERGGRGRATPEQERLVWSYQLFYPDAEYVAPFFSRFELPEGARLVVRSQDETRSWTYTAADNERMEISPEGFWGLHIYGSNAVIELFSSRPVAPGAVVIDRFARGFRSWELPGGEYPDPEDREIAPMTICGSDDSRWARCYESTEATAYSRSRTVARLLINGTSACTGWLVGNQGHVMTNNHCIDTSTKANSTNFEFLAEGSTCSTNCASWGACPGTVAATKSTFIKTSASLDYTLVRLPTNPTGSYGYLRMRQKGAVLNERIYIPQHPAHWGKRIAMLAEGANAKIDTLNAAACGSGIAELGYAADTQGGSSGSPVLGYGDHLVIGLHHCGGCPNRAIPIQRVINDLGTGNIPMYSLPCSNVSYSLSSGGTAYNPSSSGYSVSVTGAHTGRLTGPSGTDFDLYLEKWNGSAWAIVARAEGTTSSEYISYVGTSGSYRWRIKSYSGSGTATLCPARP
jgi:lysyl endopeptidase